MAHPGVPRFPRLIWRLQLVQNWELSTQTTNTLSFLAQPHARAGGGQNQPDLVEGANTCRTKVRVGTAVLSAALQRSASTCFIWSRVIEQTVQIISLMHNE